jgi:hypothetical protein
MPKMISSTAWAERVGAARVMTPNSAPRTIDLLRIALCSHLGGLAPLD